MSKRNKTAMCEYCKNLVAIGEGDYICCECDEPEVVISNYVSTKEYLKCKGNKFQWMGVQKCS